MISVARCGWQQGLVAWALGALSLAAQAHGAHQHGVVKLDVGIDGPLVTLQWEAPFDSVLGFEHPPRSAAERQAGRTLLQQLDHPEALWQPNAEAQCTLVSHSVEAPLLQQAASPAASGAGEEETHADLDASFEYRCAHVERLRSLELGLFETFARIQRVEVQVAGPQGQSRQVLSRPDKRVSLGR